MGGRLPCCHNLPETDLEFIQFASTSDSPAASAYTTYHTKMHPSLRSLYTEYLRQNSSEITSINIQNQIFSEIDCESLSKLIPELHNLSELILINNEFGITGTNYLTDQTSTMARLEKLVIARNKLNDACMEMICPTLPFMTSLKHVDLSYNEISDKGALMFADRISDLNCLEVLDLRHNRIESKGMLEVASQLKALSGARQLLFIGNSLADKCLKQLEKMFPTAE